MEGGREGEGLRHVGVMLGGRVLEVGLEGGGGWGSSGEVVIKDRARRRLVMMQEGKKA